MTPETGDTVRVSDANLDPVKNEEAYAMAKSTSKVRRKKPRKPSKDFPLFPHAAGVWAKKVCGKLRYFGPWNDPQAALSRWLEEKDDLLAGRTPRVKQPDELTVKHLADAFLTAKMDRYENGELTAATFREYRTICQHAADVFGKDRAVSDLGVSDFDALRRSFAKRHGANRLGKDIRVIRMLFKFGYDAELLDRQIRFGPNFKEPSKKTKLRERRKKGRKDFNADELRRIISEANQPLRAMIFLGINCGFGQKDCADLPMSAIEGKWIAFPRPKTEEDRRCCLWPETVEALEDAASHRGTPKDPADADCVFITRNGNRFVRMTPNADPAKQCRVDTVSHAFGRLLKSLNINGHRGFYSLRHTFATIAGESRDQVAVNVVMGHADHTMAANYRHRISDERLMDVVNVVREWLWPPENDTNNDSVDIIQFTTAG